MRNVLVSFDDFTGKEILSERDLQDYLGRYQDLKDEWIQRRQKGDAVGIEDDIVFETELIKQIEINIDYILLLVKKYHDSHRLDKEVLIDIHKAIDASPELRSKKDLITAFIESMDTVDDVMMGWQAFIAEQKEKALLDLIAEEHLNPDETRKFIEHSLLAGELKTTGTDIDSIMPPVSRFSGGNRSEKKQIVIDKLKVFFDKFFGIV